MKKVLITGASSGIGHALAVRMADAGAQVIACGRSADRLRNAFAGTDRVSPLAFDVADRAACRTALQDVRPDIAVLNAGVCEYVDVDGFDAAVFERVFAANLLGPVYCVEALLPGLKPGDQLVFVDSLARLLPFTRSQAYGASKAALHYLAKSLDTDLRDRGIVVQTVSPGFVKTPLTDRNDFAMPMRIPAAEAASEILAAIETGSRSRRFPRLFAAILAVLSALPEPLKMKVCRSLKRDGASRLGGLRDA